MLRVDALIIQDKGPFLTTILPLVIDLKISRQRALDAFAQLKDPA